MVTRVFGTADGVEISFTPSPESGKWRCLLPNSLRDSYIVELFAQDEAGNSSYLATALFTVDTTKLCIHIQWLKIEIEAEITMESFVLRSAMTKWDMELESCALCGRW